MRFLTIGGLSLLALLSGCVEYGYARYAGLDIFYQDPPSAVDIMLVVDNSCSMDPYQEKLSENFQQFISFFSEANVDYHIGILTTTVADAEPVPENGCTQSDVDAIPKGGHLVGGTYIDGGTDDAESQFADLVQLGICGSAYEMGLQSAYLAVTDHNAVQANGDFLRDDASLSIIFVANEDDYSPLGDNDYINAYRDVKGQRDRDVFNASALVVESLDDCSLRERNSGASEGDRYLDVAKQTNGVRADICADDFDPIVTDLSLNTSRLADTFYLTETPAPATLTVNVDDVDVPCDDGSWTYDMVEDADGNEVPAIIFDRDQLPPVNAKITIRYDFGDGDPSGFCTDSGT